MAGPAGGWRALGSDTARAPATAALAHPRLTLPSPRAKPFMTSLRPAAPALPSLRRREGEQM